jgi:hypothetical protein
MRRIIATAALGLLLAGCGGSGKSGSSTPSPSTATATANAGAAACQKVQTSVTTAVTSVQAWANGSATRSQAVQSLQTAATDIKDAFGAASVKGKVRLTALGAEIAALLGSVNANTQTAAKDLVGKVRDSANGLAQSCSS